jgi:hypothetical protein
MQYLRCAFRGRIKKTPLVVIDVGGWQRNINHFHSGVKPQFPYSKEIPAGKENIAMIRWIIIACLVLLSNSANAAFDDNGSGAVASGMGGASSAVAQSPWGVLSNPSLLTSIGNLYVTACVVPHRYGLTELAVGRMLLVVPSAWGTFGVSGAVEGFELYRETQIALSGAWQVGSGFQAGASVRYYHLAIAGYGTGMTVGIQLGFLLALGDLARVGFSAGNINAPGIGRLSERLPQSYRSGIALRPLRGFEIAVDLFKDILYPLQVQAGFQYELVQELMVRAGTSVEPSTFSVGLGFHLSTAVFDYALMQHPVLGISHSISVGVEL